MQTILNRVLFVSGLILAQLQSEDRHSLFVAARLLFATTAISAGFTPTEIGKLIKRHRTTVIQMKDYKPSRDYAELEKRYLKMTVGFIARSLEYLAKVWVFTNLFMKSKGK